MHFQILIALEFYATGTYYLTIGDVLRISKSSVCRVVHRVSNALCARVMSFVKFDNSEQGRCAVANKFSKIGGLPGIVGCIDCTHVRLSGPNENEEVFVNRKGFHSINVQCVMNADMMATNIVVKWPGSVHDSRILRESVFSDKFEDGTYRGRLLGDSGYPLKHWLLTPYSNPLGRAQTAFNR